MCRIYNTIGSLTDIQLQLVNNHLDEFQSLRQLQDFQDQYEAIHQKLVSAHNRLIEEEKATLAEKISAILANISQRKASANLKARQLIQPLYDKSANLFDPQAKAIPLIIDCFKNLVIWVKIWIIQALVAILCATLFLNSRRLLYYKRRRLKFLDLHFDTAVRESIAKPLRILERKRSIISKVRYSIYGALGEHEVVNVLKDLSDEYYLINNFVCTFKPALFYRKNDYIKSVQIDHVLIAPSGVFLIETKNWSSHSIENKFLRSPIEQIRRANRALYTVLKNAKSNSFLNIKKYPWGNNPVPIRNVAVFTKAIPREDFEFVKVLNINQLLSYVRYFAPAFSTTETEKIAEYLLSVSESKTIASKLKV